MMTMSKCEFWLSHTEQEFINMAAANAHKSTISEPLCFNHSLGHTAEADSPLEHSILCDINCWHPIQSESRCCNVLLKLQLSLFDVTLMLAETLRWCTASRRSARSRQRNQLQDPEVPFQTSRQCHETHILMKYTTGIRRFKLVKPMLNTQTSK